tara:strand:+ start:840 stop:974 length:135 start_codon:yes stop_codon:yes gene_type:complete
VVVAVLLKEQDHPQQVSVALVVVGKVLLTIMVVVALHGQLPPEL